MALENIAAVLKRLLRERCTQLRLMQEGKRGDVDGWRMGALADASKDLRCFGRKRERQG
jgi:hypothetical protein